jgi:molecular chaperone DnaK (HSP70)
LSKEEIDKMVLEAQQYAESDHRLREVTELRNRISGHLVALSKSYAQCGSLLDATDQQMIRDAIQKAKAMSLDESRIDVLKEAMAQLEAGAAKLTSAMFSSSWDGTDIPVEGTRGSASPEDAGRW